MQECRLQVKQDVDIWSLGCVYSEVLTWACLGWDSVTEYRCRRQTEFREKCHKDGDCFHDGNKVLQTVEEIHVDILSYRRRNDSITEPTLQLVNRMIKVGSPRLKAKELYDESKRILSDARSRLNQTSQQIIISSHGYEGQRSGSPPHRPPNLPPTSDPGTDFSSMQGLDAQQSRQLNEMVETPDAANTFPDPCGSSFSSHSHSNGRNMQTENQYAHQNYTISLPADNGEVNFLESSQRRIPYPQPGLNGAQTTNCKPLRVDRPQNEPLDNNRSRVEAGDDSSSLERGQAFSRRHIRSLPIRESINCEDRLDSSSRFSAVNPVSIPTNHTASPLPRQLSLQGGSVVSRSGSKDQKQTTKRPELSVSDGLEWKRKRERGQSIKLPHENELIDSLKKRDHVRQYSFNRKPS